MISPQRIWWRPLSRPEKSWLIVAFVWCLFLTAMMPLWLLLGRQNVPANTYRVDPADYTRIVQDFVEQYQVDTLSGVPVVEPPPGSDVYLLARQWQWYPILKLKKGETYHLHISSVDVQHGFSLQPVNLNLQILPGYDNVATIVPTESGEYNILCNEFCAIGHHIMASKLIVTD
ncbi:MAG: cytochrome C oxidase subunit II [Chloroflexi bacterium]|nr:MAG: cytochrome C oxidase subunit II [Chloroflexota bacterium]